MKCDGNNIDHSRTGTRKMWGPTVIAAVLSAAALLGIPAAERAAVAPNGTDQWLWVEPLVFCVPFLAAAVVVLMGLFKLITGRGTRTHALWVACALIYLVAEFIAVRIGHRIRMDAFKSLALRSAPLVQAIKAYELQHGRPPQSLVALVPAFLPQVPTTGMAAYPNYEYETGYSAADFHGNPWVLVVHTPSGGVNFDQFLYFPLQNYPEHGYGGRLQRLGDWAYVHE